MKKCTHCGEMLNDSAKFCKACGTKVEFVSESLMSNDSAKDNFTLLGSYIRWNVLNGQIAVKIDENDFAAYGKVKGLQIQDGVKALFFIEGKFVAELNAGSYSFKELGVDENSPHVDKPGIVRRFLSNIVGFFSGRSRERAEAAGLSSSVNANVPRVSIVLIRDTKFPLLFDLKNMPTANLQSDVVLHILCKISNVNEFYRALLLDKKFICYDEFSKKIDSLVQTTFRNVVVNVSPEQVVGNMTLHSEVLRKMQDVMAQVYPFVTVTDVLDMSASREDLNKIRKLKEELYVSELELEQLTKRNAFLNRLKDETNAQTLHDAQTQMEFVDAIAKIDEQNELNKFEREKFATMLAGQRLLHNAKSEEEIQTALLELKKSQLLREEELDNLEHNKRQRTDLRNLNDAQILALATMNNEQTFERQKMLWAFEVGQKRLENELQLRRSQDAYNDERRQKDDDYVDVRREKDLEFSTRRRNADIDLDKEEQLSQLEILKQAQAIRQEREEAEHRRQEESLASARAHEEEMRRMFQTMSVEQIIAANPDLSPAAAEAMKAKFTAEAAATAEKYKAEAAHAQNGKLEAMMQNVLQTTREDRAAEIERLMQTNSTNNANMQQMMQMFAQMGMTGMQTAAGANASINRQKAEHQAELVDVYKQQANQAHADAQKENDRMLEGMQTTLRAVAGMKDSKNQQNNRRKDVEDSVERKCPNCGAILDDGASFCEECGASV
ncbi:zinc-ribbon domain-containing protein [Fibrobacter sp. UWB12]|jgi:RNA polymerase subunit RPABC4/transcription elongation factor Spt4|uniref:zinc-ribbon domain-containing protein n=1 Tax=Fibrobacter sp. UWB12 TaxID=1896203 RepID=UPI0009169666|nr:zinc-ribbon domain-containing protein [Fibrobacter sp. UWB12]SHK66665.1 zinc-ribbon domain-containing protein [Fibrobacter sp. UWB12]